jgi:hypothetical protein
MSNRAKIQPTKFVSVNDDFDGTTYGVRVYDDYSQTYDNTWDSIPDNDMDILRKVMKSGDEVIESILESLCENEKGIYIGSNWYDYDEIKDVLNEDDEPVCICGRCEDCGGEK